jgi:adenine phosphoribosyltransferase
MMLDLKDFIRDIPDFPKPGILFRDITPLLADRQALAGAIYELAGPYHNQAIDAVVAVEARGFIFGAAVARELNAGFVPVRKKGKLPWQTTAITYGLEYGTDTIEMHTDAIKPAARVLMIDDLLATGGTMAASCQLVEKLKAKIIGLTFLIELTGLGGRDKLGNYPIHSVIKY